MIRVGLADDQPLFTSGLAFVIDSQPDLAVSWQAENGQQAIEFNTTRPVDVLLMDVQMPICDGISATRKLADSPTKVVILTTFDTQEYVVDGLGAGASGFLLKDARPEELLDAIRTVHRGESVISPRSTKRLLAEIRPLLSSAEPSGTSVPRSLRRIVEQLTPRETEILIAVAQGWSNSEICERMFVSMPTVKTHVSRILAKTGARDRVHAVLFAFRAGLVDREDLLRD